MVRRLVRSCQEHGQRFEAAENALQAFEIDPRSARLAIESVTAELVSLGVKEKTASTLARSWIRTEDFLSTALAFPTADFVIGKHPTADLSFELFVTGVKAQAAKWLALKRAEQNRV